jgi:hypothetical protein
MMAARPGVLSCYDGNDIKTWTYFFHTNRATATVVSANRAGCAERKIMKTKCKAKQIKIKTDEEAELYVCKIAGRCDGIHAGVRALLTVVGPLRITIAIKKRAARPTHEFDY